MGFTVTYASFQTGNTPGAGYTGGATAPTASQASGINLVSALLNFTDTDTTFTLTHDMGITTAQLAALLPLVTWSVVSSVQAVGTAVTPVFSITKAANTITLTKLQATGSGCTIQIDIRRPGTPGY